MRNINLEDFMKYNFLSALTYSPNGMYGAVLCSSCCEEANCYKSDLWIYRIGETTWKRLTFLGDVKSFIWLNNTELIFPAVRSEKDQKKIEMGECFTVYYRLSISGGEAQEFMRIPTVAGVIESIDENQFLVLGKYDNNRVDLNELKGEEKEKAVQTILENRDYEVFDEIPFWNNGVGVINKKRNRLYLYNREEKSLLPLSDELTDVNFFKKIDHNILYSGVRYQNIRKQTDGIYCYNLMDNTKQTILCEDLYSVQYIDRLDGTLIFIGSRKELYGSSENPSVFTVVDGDVELLTKLPFGYGNSIGTDCRYGAFHIIKSYNNLIYMVVTEYCESVIKTLNSNGIMTTICDGNGSIDDFDVCDTGLMMVTMKVGKLQEVYSLNNKIEMRISDFNTTTLSELKVILPKKININHDGLIIEGFVIRPANYSPSKRYPAILSIHGGPKTAYGSVYFHEMQVWASMGYYVLFCNPRGSDGRGDEFADIRGKYGTVDYDDLMKFTDEVLKIYPQIDVDKIAAVGGSYGGFMVNWIIGHTDRFACGVSQRSISNWISKSLTTDIGYYHNMDQQACTPWDNYEKMWWHSPLKYADKVKTPTLFIHSDEDYRCWQGEGLQMFTALKLFGVESRLCLFHGENHELGRSGKPLHRVRRLKEIMVWLDHYLQ